MADKLTWAELYRFSEPAIHYMGMAVNAVVSFAIGWFVAGLLHRGVLKMLAKIKGVDPTVSYFLANAVRYAVLVIVVIAILGDLGVHTASILAALGGAILAIGLALQGTLQNIAAGLMLLFLRPFRIGEYIVAGSIQGTVQEIGLFTTDIVTSDGLYLCAPNSALWNTPIVNQSRRPTRRHDYTVGIGYEADINQAFALVKGIITAEPDVLPKPEPQFFVSELADSAVILSCRYWIKNSAFYDVSRRVNQAVKEAFDKNGISIPYPQMTYHSGDTPPNTPPFANAAAQMLPSPAASGHKQA